MIYQGVGYGFTINTRKGEPNRIRLDLMDYDLGQEILQWFRENTKQSFETTRIPVWEMNGEKIFIAPLYFDLDDEDTMMFKLRWAV